MTDKELADALVALKVIRISSARDVWDRYRLVKADGFVLGGAYDVVRDWRVAGTLIERVIEERTYDDIQPHPDPSDSVARDFIAKCVTVLTVVTDGQK